MTQPTTEARIADIQRRITAAQQEVVQAASLKAAAEERVREVTDALASQFHVTPGEAPELLTRLEHELSAEIDKLQLLLEGAGL